MLGTNIIIFTNSSVLQGTRFLKRVSEVCMNKKSFTNFILKQGKQVPHQVVLTMIRLISVGVLFRVSMMFLKANGKTILEKIYSMSVDEERKRDHAAKIERLLRLYYPSKTDPEDRKREFFVMERWVGHDLLTKSVMQESESANGRTMTELSKSKFIPKLQWDMFELKEKERIEKIEKAKAAMKANVMLKEPKREMQSKGIAVGKYSDTIRKSFSPYK